MEEDLKSRIELSLKDLGYKYDDKLYDKVSKMSYNLPSYKIIADTVLKSISNSNSIIGSYKSWKYTTKFVEGMKSNLVMNNSYFQSVFENGLFSPYTENQDSNINLFDIKNFRNNEYSYLKNILISNNKNAKKDKRIFDFTIVINGFPLVLIEVVDNDLNYSFKDTYSIMEENFDKFPMFFNFNKLILFTDGNTWKLGSIYDFPEEYISFNSLTKESHRKGYHNVHELENIFSTNNILKILCKNRNGKQLDSFLRNNLTQKVNFKTTLENNKIDNNDEIQDIDFSKDDEDLSFLADFFNPDLDKIIESEDFKKNLDSIREVPNFKENKAYIEDIRNKKNNNTLETFVKANEKLIIKEVNKFSKYQTSSMDLDDMYQLGCIGLIEAMENFDLEMENEFSTYAVYWIRKCIIRGINNDSLLIRIPSYKWDSLLKLHKLENRSLSLFNNLDYDWISKELKISKDKIIDLITIRNSFMNNVSLDTPIAEDGETTLQEFIVDKNHNIEDIVLNMDLKNRLKEQLNILDDRSKDVIIKRFGLNGQDCMTLQEIGSIYSVSRERIRQIESNALNKLSNLSTIKKFKEYCEG